MLGAIGRRGFPRLERGWRSSSRRSAPSFRRGSSSASHAALWGRTNYGRAFTKFDENFFDALTPKTTLLILGDARSNYSDLHEDTLRRLTGAVKRSFWLNPEHERNWGTGDSAAPTYGEIVPMIECRNLVQLQEFVHDLAW